jgi:hypothetical protein
MTGSDEKGTPIIISIVSTPQTFLFKPFLNLSLGWQLGLASFGSGIVAGVTFFNAKTFSNLINDNNNLAAIGVSTLVSAFLSVALNVFERFGMGLAPCAISLLH